MSVRFSTKGEWCYMLKWLGCILILFSSAAIGMYCSMQVKSRLQLLRSLKKSLVLLRGDITYAGSSLPESIGGLGRDADDAVGRCFSWIGTCLTGFDKRPMSAIWEEGCERELEQTSLDREEIRRFKTLGRNLENGDRKQQIDKLSLYLEQLELSIGENEADCKNKTKVYNTLGIAIGLMTVIVLI